MAVLVTGVAGFIGSHVALYLLGRGDDVIGVDNFNNYYDPSLKRARIRRVVDFAEGGEADADTVDLLAGVDATGKARGAFELHEIDLADRAAMERLFATRSIRSVVHLGAQAGVRHSLTDPFPYIDSNVTGFLTILEGARHTGVDHLVYASTSSVYGAVTDMPFNVSTPADYPLSLYGATKRANELMAHAYAHLFAIPVTGLRFFTVYGPWGRPDMALFLFTRKILAGEPIDVFNYGQHKRDFTFIDDIVRGVVAALDTPAEANPRWDGNAPDAATAGVPWRVHNIGNQRPVELMRYIEILEQELGARAERNLLPMQAGDVAETYADVDTLVAATGYRPRIQVEEGVRRFVAWYRRYYAL